MVNEASTIENVLLLVAALTPPVAKLAIHESSSNTASDGFDGELLFVDFWLPIFREKFMVNYTI